MMLLAGRKIELDLLTLSEAPHDLQNILVDVGIFHEPVFDKRIDGTAIA